MNFLRQGFSKLTSDRQTRPKLYTTPPRQRQITTDTYVVNDKFTALYIQLYSPHNMVA